MKEQEIPAEDEIKSEKDGAREKADLEKEPEETGSTQNPKEGDEILKDQIRMALTEYRRHNKALFLSSFSGGLEIGFSVLLMGTLFTMFHEQLSEPSMELVLGFSYSIGFIFVILGRSELFTEHTTLAVLPVLNRSVSILHLLELWAVIFAGNMIGGYFFSFILSEMGPAMGVVEVTALEHIAKKMTRYNGWITLGSGIFAGWLMGLLSWLVTSSKDTISRILIIILVTSVIGIAGLHHSIVGSVEVFTGFLVSQAISIQDYLHFQFWTTIGNIIGGTVFVAVVKYSHLGDKVFIKSKPS